MSIAAIKKLLGAGRLFDQPSDMAPYLTSWRGGFAGEAELVALPDSTQLVSDIVKICHEHQIPITPQGGNTGLVGGSVPAVSGGIVLSLSRMNKIRMLDTANFTVTVEAGVVLATLQEKVHEAGLLFPLSMGSEGSALIGGAIATNAGGTSVLRYGSMRSLVLGLEVVLSNGDIWHGLRTLHKDNTGYDLKQLIIGSEGTLGIVTAANLKLFPMPQRKETVFLGLENAAQALELFRLFRTHCGETLLAFELISHQALEFVLHHVPGSRNPVAEQNYYLLVETDAPRIMLEEALAQAYENQLITDGAIADTIAQAKDFWRLRESISESARAVEGFGAHFDISVPIAKIPDFLSHAKQIVEDELDVIAFPFGHMGDGNIHYNLKLKNKEDAPAMQSLIYALLEEMGGSISAEHGIGQLRREDLKYVKSETELEIMKKIKQALDPQSLLNSGKLLPEA